MNKTGKVVGLFVIAALSVYACSDSEETYSEYEDDCYDDNNDGYCDDDGSRVGSTYVDIDGHRKYKKLYSGVTSGSKAQGGIGSSGISSSG